ncbi:MAG: CHAD domain-containing protein [Solirubrobacterales bacterium]
MARARQVELDCEQPFAAAAAKVVEVRAAEVFEQAQGVLDVDRPERVHDMRVATRRLRAAMEVFASCFPRKRGRRALKEVKALADALGERRDRDVEIEFLERFAVQVPPGERDQTAALIARLREERLGGNDDLAPFLAPERLRHLRRRLARLVEAAR